MERHNAKSSIYLCYNNNYNKVWKPSPYDDGVDDDDVDHVVDDGFCYVDHDGGMMMMASWPPRSYTCSFCKREFRSAQALGGHMNVHRRDRAQLRQLSQITPNSSPININLNLPPNNNPNANHVFLSSPTTNPAFAAKKIQPLTPSPTVPPSDLITRKQFECFRRKNNLVVPQAFDRFRLKQREDHDQGHLEKSGGLIRLGLEMNINVADHHHGAFKEDLDLELRLGYN